MEVQAVYKSTLLLTITKIIVEERVVIVIQIQTILLIVHWINLFRVHLK